MLTIPTASGHSVTYPLHSATIQQATPSIITTIPTSAFMMPADPAEYLARTVSFSPPQLHPQVMAQPPLSSTVQQCFVASEAMSSAAHVPISVPASVRQVRASSKTISEDKPEETKEEAREALEVMFQIRASKIRQAIENGQLATAEALQHKVIQRRESLAEGVQRPLLQLLQEPRKSLEPQEPIVLSSSSSPNEHILSSQSLGADFKSTAPDNNDVNLSMDESFVDQEMAWIQLTQCMSYQQEQQRGLQLPDQSMPQCVQQPFPDPQWQVTMMAMMMDRNQPTESVGNHSQGSRNRSFMSSSGVVTFPGQQPSF
ncbi:hypothetical protein BG011_002147 [Mortierella polycephala]|uniref:Uncharacterized protein n=1 Tax=Mortierella polycephala TaxID=41804 RepID=A0A9P6Q523_9FUNG|nr:hypothetical protein BG011_002147 [Mortierella polycephala]